MQKPEPLKPEALQHPNETTYKAWNGDERKKRSTRWNGASDMDDKGFTSRGVRTVEGTRPPSNVRPVTNGKKHPGAHAPMTRDLKPTQDPQVFEPVMRPRTPINRAPLTDRQKKMMRKPK